MKQIIKEYKGAALVYLITTLILVTFVLMVG
nr:MAG TPA: hypothetical protein [Caudoviricetes sp.]